MLVRLLVLILLWATLAPTPMVRAGTVVVSDSTPLVAEPDGNREIATVSAGAELTILDDRGPLLHVALRGWTRQGGEKVLFALPGKWILVARVNTDGIELLQSLGSQTDPVTGTAWQHLGLDGWIETARTRTSAQMLWQEAWTLFTERCTACHVQRVPAHYTANQWRSHLKVMGPRTGLSRDQQSLILTFLQNHASDTIDATIAAGTAHPPATRR